MPFKIVQTIEAGEICLAVVPAGWENKGILYWPRKSAVAKLSLDENSLPEPSWEQMNCIKKREFATRKEAEYELDLMQLVSETETEMKIVCPPRNKKIRQELKKKQVGQSDPTDFNKFVDHLQSKKSEIEVQESSHQIVVGAH